MKINLNSSVKFENRHNGPSTKEVSSMLQKINATSLEELIDQTIPKSIQFQKRLNLPQAQSESEFLRDFRSLAKKNKIYKSFIGLGYYDTILPSVIVRNILENPGWYTAYTPYQAEIAQGRLEALINFQTVVMELTGMELANASLLDEGTAAAEAMAMLHAVKGKEKKQANKFFVDEKIFPQTLAVLKTRSAPIGIDLVVGPLADLDLEDPDLYGIMLQYPNGDGEVLDHRALISNAKQHHVLSAFAAD